MGERVNKIRFDGNIKKEIRLRNFQYIRFSFWEKNQRREKRPRRAAFSAKLR